MPARTRPPHPAPAAGPASLAAAPLARAAGHGDALHALPPPREPLMPEWTWPPPPRAAVDPARPIALPLRAAGRTRPAITRPGES